MSETMCRGAVLRVTTIAAASCSFLASVAAQNPFTRPEEERRGYQLWAELGYGSGDQGIAASSEREEHYLGFLRARVEITSPPGIGLGVAGEVAVFDGSAVVGPAPFPEDVDGTAKDTFVYAVYTGQTERLRCPLRLGVAFVDLTLEAGDERKGRRYEYGAGAFRLQAEAEFALLDDGTTRLSVYALGSYTWGGGEYESVLDDIREDLDLTQAGFEFGARLRLGPVWIGLGWARNETRWRGDDVFSDLDLTFEGLVFSIGASN